jgi:alpha-tubulin suppressor-like RCC1 family protein
MQVAAGHGRDHLMQSFYDDAEAADPVLLQALEDMGFAEEQARVALERTGNRSLEAAIDHISAKMAGLGAGPGAAKARLSARALGPDGLNAVLLRLVATCGAEQLCRCAGVCQMWYAEAVNEELWQVLLRRRWGEAADEIRASWQPGDAEAAMSSRALYVRSVTSQVLSWGQGARCQEEVGTAPRKPAVHNDGLRGLGIRQVSAGLWFSCAVTWSGKVLCWGVNTQGQCGVPVAEASYVSDPVELDLAGRFAAQVSGGREHAACVTTCGLVFCWGNNSSNQLGQTRGAATPLLESPPPSIPFTHSPQRPWLRRRGFGLCARGGRGIGRSSCPRFTAVACGHEHICALTAEGMVFTWGSNTAGQCGPATTVEGCAMAAAVESPLAQGVVRVSAGAAFSLFVTDQGMVSMGANNFGQATESQKFSILVNLYGKHTRALIFQKFCQLGRETQDTSDAQPGLVELAALSRELCHEQCQEGAGGGATAVSAVTVKDLSCGDDHSLLVLSDESVYVWGRGTQGVQLKKLSSLADFLTYLLGKIARY